MSGFVKLDCGMLDSTIWVDHAARNIFITALLMAEPEELLEETPQLEVRNLNQTGWTVPSGWYGFVPASGIGIVRRAGIEDETGLAALERLGSPEGDSRSPEFEGRRLVRVAGGYLILNYMRYRDHDYTAAARSRRYRARKKGDQQPPERHGVTRDERDARRNVTHAEAEAEAEAYPEKEVPSEPVGQARPAEGKLDLVPTTPPRPDPVEAVFNHWREVHARRRTPLTDKRRKLIAARLREYSEADLCQSISGYKNSPFHQGKNDRDTVYDDIELMLRDAKQVDAGLRFYAEPPRKHLSAKTRQVIDQTEGWTSPDSRRARNDP